LRSLSTGRLEAAGYGRQDACRYDAFWLLAQVVHAKMICHIFFALLLMG
jgi:hypothetical protein